MLESWSSMGDNGDGHCQEKKIADLSITDTDTQTEQKCNYCYQNLSTSTSQKVVREKGKIESWTHLHQQAVSSWSGPPEGVQCTATDAFGGSNALWCFHNHNRLRMMTGEVHLHVLSSGHYARVLLSFYLYLCVSSFLFTLQLLISSTGIVQSRWPLNEGARIWRKRFLSQSSLHNWLAPLLLVIVAAVDHQQNELPAKRRRNGSKFYKEKKKRKKGN